MFLKVSSAEYLNGHRLRLSFSDGACLDVDLGGVLSGPVFAPLRDASYFKQFKLEGHSLAWPNGADFAPEYLRDLAASQSGQGCSTAAAARTA